MFNYPYYQNFNPTTPRQEIVNVNGENGARAYQLAPNSSALLLDSSAPIVWLVQTDGAGYKTVTAYDITEHKPETAPDVGDLEARISRLEAMFNESYTRQNEQQENRCSKAERADSRESTDNKTGKK